MCDGSIDLIQSVVPSGQVHALVVGELDRPGDLVAGTGPGWQILEAET